MISKRASPCPQFGIKNQPRECGRLTILTPPPLPLRLWATPKERPRGPEGHPRLPANISLTPATPTAQKKPFPSLGLRGLFRSTHPSPIIHPSFPSSSIYPVLALCQALCSLLVVTGVSTDAPPDAPPLHSQGFGIAFSPLTP